MVIVFDCAPSNIEQIYWSYTLRDIKVKLRLYLSERQATHVQNYQTLAKVVSQALGGGKTGKEGTPDLSDVEVPTTKEGLQAAFNSVFG